MSFTITQIREVFIRSGRGKSIADVEKILSDVGLNLGKIIEQKMLRKRKKNWKKRRVVIAKELERRQQKRRRI